MADDDWRLRGQEDYLQGATLQRKAYRMWSEKWDHDHCEFCWAKFLDPTAKFTDPNAAAWLTKAIESPEILTEGYAVQGRSPKEDQTNEYWWICPTCVGDFCKRFEWKILDGPANVTLQLE